MSTHDDIDPAHFVTHRSDAAGDAQNRQWLLRLWDLRPSLLRSIGTTLRRDASTLLDREDVFQAFLLHCVQKRSLLEPHLNAGEDAGAYLYRAAVNFTRYLLSHERRRTSDEPVPHIGVGPPKKEK